MAQIVGSFSKKSDAERKASRCRDTFVNMNFKVVKRVSYDVVGTRKAGR